MSNVDPVAVARAVWNEAITEPGAWKVINGREALALAIVVIAAEERAKLGHDKECRRHAVWGMPFAQTRCTCGHDALSAALRGEEGKP
jgi:hypothetical protein